MTSSISQPCKTRGLLFAIAPCIKYVQYRLRVYSTDRGCTGVQYRPRVYSMGRGCAVQAEGFLPSACAAHAFYRVHWLPHHGTLTSQTIPEGKIKSLPLVLSNCTIKSLPLVLSNCTKTDWARVNTSEYMKHLTDGNTLLNQNLNEELYDTVIHADTGQSVKKICVHGFINSLNCNKDLLAYINSRSYNENEAQVFTIKFKTICKQSIVEQNICLPRPGFDFWFH